MTLYLGRSINRALKLDFKFILLSFLTKCKEFGILFLIETDNNVFTNNNILDAIFTLSVKNVTSDRAAGAGTPPCWSSYSSSVILQHLPCLCRARLAN